MPDNPAPESVTESAEDVRSRTPLEREFAGKNRNWLLGNLACWRSLYEAAERERNATLSRAEQAEAKLAGLQPLVERLREKARKAGEQAQVTHPNLFQEGRAIAYERAADQIEALCGEQE